MQGIGIALLAAFSIFCMLFAASAGRADASLAEQKRCFDALEEEYVRNMGRLLSDSGYANSGITLTSIIEEDGSREYTVLLHHRRFWLLTQEERKELIAKLKAISFAKENCTFRHQFL